MNGWRGISLVGLEQTGSPILVLTPDEMNQEKLEEKMC